MTMMLNKAALVVAIAAAEITHDQAVCIMEGKKVAFFGDSVTRFCYFGFNYWLETGTLPDDENIWDGEEWGLFDEDRDDCCTRTTWTDYYLESSQTKHRQYFKKSDFGSTFSSQPYTEFYFIQDVYYDDDETDGEPSIESIGNAVKDYDYIVYNCGWWNLKDKDNGYCGEDWDSGCQSRYETMWDGLASTMFSGEATAVYRGSTCCGEDEDVWIDAIQDQNDAAKTLIEAAGGSFVDVFDLYGYDEILDRSATFDETHANSENCLAINKMILQALDLAANGGACTTGSSSSSAPTHSPTYPPSVGMSMPPTRGAGVPTETCVDDAAWYKNLEPSKTCDWVDNLLPTRCQVKGWDGHFAYEACRASCDTCVGLCAGDDSDAWMQSTNVEKDCEWAADVYPARCSRISANGTFGFEACPYACRTCVQDACADSTTWHMNASTSRDCDWVARSSGVRCGKEGVDSGESVLAFVGCPDACRVCPGFQSGGGECEDDADWHKTGEPSSDCAWVANNSPRCRAKGTTGDESTYAFESCRVACNTC